ncbi:cobyric acid synthase [Rhodococcus sp. IEGM 1401]|uniref:cobyric acid synthase n=1 Tax=unclassified Rhodococcus (in: high G+C Gram-positive bacteria) TaxID=192944 RepID=UPI0022B36AA1|nr:MULTISPECIES: cobyric acid synthase [unclassified Rhodococcus (in: high G+C Gram-positive bacteria)]MCZ4559564.1 cobyric acid synthase [Rhodococcus sp. IEGM 1401]MDI9919483.1 cobyric acid synthase [Rhodococcus sp. IEGM 1372]MDV8032144.1 cobyric acid synthase [Rhodococcus sp. IEGM 1414]
MNPKGALLVAGTTSDAGKSVLVAGLCRMLARRGVRVAPFKAQNMSNNSVVTLDGGEIGRAQAMQASACGLEPSVRFNPVLLKPGSDRTSQLVVRGRAVAQVSASNYIEHRQSLRAVVADELASLREEFDVVICEGAGSPAEINLRATDLANMGLATAASLPVIVVGDIDRGGVLAHLFGTVAVLSPEDQALVAGFVINKFRGDPALLAPGLDQLRALTGRPTYGVVPFADGLWMDAEDSLGTVPDAPVGRPRAPYGSQWLRVAAVRLPRISNTTDVEALACEPGVSVHWVTEPSRLEDVDLVVVPGSKSTVSDLEWLRRTGLADAIAARGAAGLPVLGICGGYQMLGRTIDDTVESGAGAVRGLGLLDLDIEFAADKVLAQVAGQSMQFGPNSVSGYEIHHGRVARNGDDALSTTASGISEGSLRGSVLGTHWHGLLESDDFRRSLLAWVAEKSGRTGFEVAPDTSVAALREQQLDLLADLVEDNLDVDAVLDLIEHGVDPGLDTIVTQLL